MSIRVALVMYGDTLSGGGGAERRFLTLWRYFRHRELDVHLIINERLFVAARSVGLLSLTDLSSGGLIVIDRQRGVEFSLAAYRAIVEGGCEVVHLVLAQRALIALYALLAVRRPVRVVHTVALSWFTCPGMGPLSTRLLSRWLWRLADQIDSLYQGFAKAYAIPLGFANKVSTAPCSFVATGLRDQRCAKENLIIFAGRLIPEKNPLLFVQAIRMLVERGIRGIEFVIAGDGPQREAVAAAICAGCLEALVSLGPVDDLPALLARSRMFVSLQRTENYPSQSLLEAMAAENLIIATDVGETRRLVRHGETGLLVGANATEIAAAIEHGLVAEDLCRDLGRAARSFVMRHHRIDRFAAHLHRTWLAARARGERCR